MKRALIALVAVGFVVAAISIARAHSGEQDTSEASSTPADKSKDFDRDLTRDQTRRQAEQVLKAQADIKERVAELAEDGPHTLAVTIREERPGDVWILGKVDGKPACVTPSKKVPTYINVTGSAGQLVTEVVPLEANLLKSGACEASLELFVHHQGWYDITVAGADPFGLAKVGHQAGQPQKVTIVG